MCYKYVYLKCNLLAEFGKR